MVPGVLRRGDPAPRTELVAVGVSNAIPLAGVLALGWDAAALLALYWVELGVLSLFALVRATFAGRPSEFDGDPPIAGALASRRLSLSLPWTGVAVRGSTLPVLAAAAPVLALLWGFAGATTVGVVGPPPSGAEAAVGLAVVGILAAETGRTVVDYFYRGAYRDHSAQTAIRGVLSRGIAVAMGGLFVVTGVALASDSIASDQPIGEIDPALIGTPLLVGIVLVKFGADLVGVYWDRIAAYDESTGIDLGIAYDPPSDDPVDGSLSGDPVRVGTDRRALLVGGVPNAARYPSTAVVGAFVLLVAGLFAVGGAWGIVAVLVAVAVAVAVALGTADYWLRYAGVTYLTDGDAVVARDRLSGTPLWRVESWDETGLRVERDRLDAWLGTSTVAIELPDDEERRLSRLSDPEPILDAFDRPADRPAE